MKLGARILKTGIAIVLALVLANLLDLPTPVFAGIAAIFAIQPTIYRSYLSIVEQIQGNLIGAVIAVLFVLLFGNHVFFIGLSAMIVISINLKLRIEKTIPLSLVTLIAIMETPSDSFINFAIIRFMTIMVGILSAFFINLIFLPPKYESKLYHHISDISEDITKWIRLNIRHASDHRLLKQTIETLSERVIKADQLYLMYKEERNYWKKNDIVKSRKLVIYRQMITTVKRSYYTLKTLHRFENELLQMPAEFQHELQQQLDCLIHHHEHVMLKFIGKVRPNVKFEEGHITLDRTTLFNLFLHHNNHLETHVEPSNYHIMQVISAVIEYDENVEHLDMLITSFQSYHQGEVDVTLEEAT